MYDTLERECVEYWRPIERKASWSVANKLSKQYQISKQDHHDSASINHIIIMVWIIDTLKLPEIRVSFQMHSFVIQWHKLLIWDKKRIYSTVGQ